MNRNTTATILIVLALGVYFTVTQKFWAEAKAVKAVNDQYTSAISNAEQLIRVREKVLKDYNNLSASDRERLDKLLPSTVDNIRLIIDLNNVAVQHGLALKNIKAATTPQKGLPGQAASAAAPVPNTASNPVQTGIIPTPTLDTVTINFSVTAPYQQFISFLQDLEANLRIMDVTHLSVASNDSGQYEYSVELRTYWLRSQ